MSKLENTFDTWHETEFKDKDMARAFDEECTKANIIKLIEEVKFYRAQYKRLIAVPEEGE